MEEEEEEEEEEVFLGQLNCRTMQPTLQSTYTQLTTSPLQWIDTNAAYEVTSVKTDYVHEIPNIQTQLININIAVN